MTRRARFIAPCDTLRRSSTSRRVGGSPLRETVPAGTFPPEAALLCARRAAPHHHQPEAHRHPPNPPNPPTRRAWCSAKPSSRPRAPRDDSHRTVRHRPTSSPRSRHDSVSAATDSITSSNLPGWTPSTHRRRPRTHVSDDPSLAPCSPPTAPGSLSGASTSTVGTPNAAPGCGAAGCATRAVSARCRRLPMSTPLGRVRTVCARPACDHTPQITPTCGSSPASSTSAARSSVRTVAPPNSRPPVRLRADGVPARGSRRRALLARSRGSRRTGPPNGGCSR
jgi:hypothetical protein